MKKMRKQAKLVGEEEKESLAELSLFTNTSLGILMTAGKYTLFMKDYLFNMTKVDKP